MGLDGIGTNRVGQRNVAQEGSSSRTWSSALDLMRIARSINTEHGNNNCVDCSIAFDHAIAGVPMTAPNSGMKSGDKLAAAYGVTSKAFEEFSTASELVASFHQRGLTQGIIMAVQRRPHPQLPDMREVVSGHVVNIVSDGRQPIVIDAQAGMPLTPRFLDDDPVWDGFFLLATDQFH
jgi:hypothetical protein